MAYYNTCSFCGSNLDPGESCDCKSNERKPEQIAKADERRVSPKEKDRPKKQAVAV